MRLLDADHVASATGEFEPQRQNNFSVRISPPAGVNVGGAYSAEELISLSLTSYPMPQEESALIAIWQGNERRSVAGRTTYTDETLTVKDYVDRFLAEIFIEWRKKCYNPETGQIGWARDYKVNGDVIMFGPDGTGIRTWELIGAWPFRVRYGEGNMTNNAQNNITVDFRVDKIKWVSRDIGASVA